MQTPSLNHNPLDSGLPIVRLLSLVLGLSLPMSGFAADAVTVNGERNFNLGPQTTFTLDGETFQPLPDQPIVITAAERVRFVRL